jgi:hypothetical protein
VSRPIRCARCAEEAAPTEYGTPPPGWITLTISGPPFQPPIECCSVICALATLNQERERV